MNSNELTYSFLQIIAILQPKIEGTGKNKSVIIDPENIDNLFRFDFNKNLKETKVFVGSDFKVKRFFDYGKYAYKDDPKEVSIKEVVKIGIRSNDFQYVMDPTQVLDIWNKFKSLLPKYEPEIVTFNDKWSHVLNLDQSDINNIKVVSKFTSLDWLREGLQCVYFHDGFMVGCDTHRLIRRPISFTGEFYLPIAGQKFISSCKKWAKIYENETHIKIETVNKNTIIEKYNGSKYPDYKVLLGKPMNKTIIINRERLINAVNQVCEYANKASHKISFDFRNDNLIVSAMDLDFGYESKSIIHSRYFTSDYTDVISCNYLYLLSILKLSKDENVTIQLNDNKTQTIIDGCLLIPVVQDEEPVNVKITGKLDYSIVNGKYSRSIIMKNAWLLWRSGKFETWSDCLKESWSLAKFDMVGHNITMKNIGIAA